MIQKQNQITEHTDASSLWHCLMVLKQDTCLVLLQQSIAIHDLNQFANSFRLHANRSACKTRCSAIVEGPCINTGGYVECKWLICSWTA